MICEKSDLKKWAVDCFEHFFLSRRLQYIETEQNKNIEKGKQEQSEKHNLAAELEASKIIDMVASLK